MNEPKKKYQLGSNPVGFEHIKNIKNIKSIIQEYIKNTYTIQEHHSPPSPSSDGEEDATAFFTTATAATGSRYCPMERGGRDSLLPPPPDEAAGRRRPSVPSTRSGGGRRGAPATAPPLTTLPPNSGGGGVRRYAGRARLCRARPGDLHPRAASASCVTDVSFFLVHSRPDAATVATSTLPPHLLARRPCSVVCAAGRQQQRSRRHRTNSACASCPPMRGFAALLASATSARATVIRLASTVPRRVDRCGQIRAGWARFTTVRPDPLPHRRARRARPYDRTPLASTEEAPPRMFSCRHVSGRPRGFWQRTPTVARQLEEDGGGGVGS